MMAQSRYFNVVAIYAWLSKWSTNRVLAFVLRKQLLKSSWELESLSVRSLLSLQAAD